MYLFQGFHGLLEPHQRLFICSKTARVWKEVASNYHCDCAAWKLPMHTTPARTIVAGYSSTGGLWQGYPQDVATPSDISSGLPKYMLGYSIAVQL